MEHADDVVGLFTPKRQTGIGGSDDFLHDFRRRQVRVERQHLGAMDHDVRNGQFLEVEQAAEHVAIGFGDAAFLVHQVHGAFQFLLGRQQGVRLAEAQAEEKQRAANDLFDAEEDWAEQADKDGNGPRDHQRHAIWIVDRHGLGQDFREDQQNHGHDRGGVDRALVADQTHQHGGQKGRRADIEQGVAQQHGAEQTVATAEHADDGRRPRIALFFQGVHARPGGRRHRRLGS